MGASEEPPYLFVFNPMSLWLKNTFHVNYPKIDE